MRALLSPCHPLQLVLGLVLWSLWFVLIYGGLSVLCAFAAPPATQGQWTLANLLLGASALPLFAFSGWLALRGWRAAGDIEQSSAQRFVALTGAGIHVIGMLATLFVALPLLILPPCV